MTSLYGISWETSSSVYEKPWPPKKKKREKKRKEKKYIYEKKKRKKEERGLAKLFRAKFCFEVKKNPYEISKKRVLCAGRSWDLLVRDVSWAWHWGKIV